MRNLIKNVLIFILIFVVIAGIFSSFNLKHEEPRQITMSELVTYIQEDAVADMGISSDDAIVEITLVPTEGQEAGEVVQTRKEVGSSFVEQLTNLGVTTEQLAETSITVKEPSRMRFWTNALLPFLFPILILGFIIFFMARQVSGFNQKAMNFGQGAEKEGQKQERPKTLFKDVAGAKEAKEELKEIVEFLKYPQKFTSLGAKVPKGVLLMGPPGTGKTLLAKAVAGEAGVPFISISGSEFVEMFVGVGASRVRALFAKAKKQAPAIIFVDEIDAVGRRRGTGMGGSHDEREQTLNQILVELDGFNTSDNVIVMAATNRPDVLDPALLRPGRFDRRVTIDSPDINDREAILKIHAANKPLSSDVDLRVIAQRTPGFSGADLANLINEAAILAARQNKQQVAQLDIISCIEKVMIGPERKSHILTDHEKNITAYHEAGHALVAHMLPHVDPVHKVSIISRGQAGGYMLRLPENDKHMHSRKEFIEDLSVMLGGHAAETEVFGDITTGATSDLQGATKLAKNIVTQYGMSDKLGPRTFGQREEMIFLGKEIHEQRDYSESTAQQIDEEMNNLIADAYKVARKIITEQRELLNTIVEKLMVQETLERAEFEKIVGPKPAITE